MAYYLFGACLGLLGLLARIAVWRVAGASAVDQHYWSVAAKAYQEQQGLPVRIVGKYLMEDEEQAYPPFFGILVGRLLPDYLKNYATLVIEGLELAGLAGFMAILGLPPGAIVMAASFYIAAPVLVVYNAQLTPRILGDFFLSSAMALQVLATLPSMSAWRATMCWAGSALMLGLMFMTHKMTYQLHLVLLPFWAWALHSWVVLLPTLLGILIFVVTAGPRFALLQLRAHWDIVSFWNRHWKDLGAHQFMDSPIYGDGNATRGGRFHGAGLRGAIKHLRVAVSYAPFATVLPMISLALDYWPPTWVMVWLGVTCVWALATLFVPPLKCFGGGHLYLFNAIIPGVLYIAFLPREAATYVGLGIALLLTLTALWLGWRTVKNRPMARGEDFQEALQYLRTLPDARIAVFPLQAAEAVAAQSGHAVLWGGHGYGFRNLEGFFPVFTRPLSEYVRRYNVGWILWDSLFWPQGEVVLLREKMMATSGQLRSFGRWRLARL
jgi:hypothetical protein